MLSARSIKKLLILFSIMVPMSFTAAEARRAYQTVDTPTSLDASDIEDAADNSNETVVVATPKRQAPSKQDKQDKQDRQDKQTHQSVNKAMSDNQAPEPLLTSPLDVMMQFENERQASTKDTHIPATGKPGGAVAHASSLKTSNSDEEATVVKKKMSTHDKAPPVAESQSTSKKPFSSPVEMFVTAVAIGVCLYSLSKKLLSKSSLKSRDLTQIKAQAGGQISQSISLKSD